MTAKAKVAQRWAGRSPAHWWQRREGTLCIIQTAINREQLACFGAIWVCFKLHLAPGSGLRRAGHPSLCAHLPFTGHLKRSYKIRGWGNLGRFVNDLENKVQKAGQVWSGDAEALLKLLLFSNARQVCQSWLCCELPSP